MIEYLSKNQIADHLGLSSQTIAKYYAQGRLPEPDAKCGNVLGWLPETIDAWQKARPGHGGRPPLQGGKNRFGLNSKTK